MKRGISLITLIITIVVIIILAAAVVLSLTANNPINSAKKAALISNRESIMSAINLYYSNATINLNIQNNFNNSYNQETILTGIGNTEDMTGEVKSYRITSLKDGVDENSNSLTKDDLERETIQIENNDIEVFKIDEKKAKEKGINIPSTNKNSSWYFDKSGIVYLVFEENADIPSNIKGNPEEGKLIEDNDLSKFISKKGYKYIKKSIYDLVPESPVEMFTYENKDGDIAITGINTEYTGKIPSSVKFPSEDPEGNKITAIWIGAFKGNTIFETVVIPEGVTILESYAFESCTNLKEIYLPSTLSKSSYIVYTPFKNCENITKITIPNSVVNGTEFKPSNMFQFSLSTIEEVEFSDEILGISDSAFRGFSKLTKIKLPDTITSIGKNSFYGCSNLTGKLIVPENVEVIDECAFYSCNITELEFKSKGKLTKIMNCAFLGNKFEKLIIPEGVTILESYAFESCTNLKEVYLPASIIAISNGVYTPFKNCQNITKITISNSVVNSNQFNPSRIFQHSLFTIIEVEFCGTITSISSNAFSGFSSITSITIPESVTQIGSSAFSGCSSLTTINYKGDATGAPWGATNATVIK